MKNTALDLSEIMLDFESFHADTVDIMPHQVQLALDLSHSMTDQSQQWQVYLNALGLSGFENWLAENSSDLTLNSENCSLNQPELNPHLEAICQLQVNQFKVCLLTLGSFTDEVVTVPQMVLDLPEYAAHFYVIVEVQEELETARVSGFFSYQDWQQHQATTPLQPESDWTYSVPLSWINLNSDQLFLQWRCLEPSHIPLPAIPNRTVELTEIQAELEQILPRLHSEDDTIKPLWQQLTWEQGIAVLTQPELLQWVHQIQTVDTPNPAVVSQLRLHLSDLFQLLTQPSLNVGNWLSNQFNQITADWSWVFLPNLSLSPALAMRSGSEDLTTILQELQQAGVEIPTQPEGAYRDLVMGDSPLRLYTVTWSLDSDVNPEWVLLLVLGTPSGINLPAGVKLRVSDGTGILDEQQLTVETPTPYLYTQVMGSWQEKFVATVSLSSGVEETLPPFTFNPQSN